MCVRCLGEGACLVGWLEAWLGMAGDLWVSTLACQIWLLREESSNLVLFIKSGYSSGIVKSGDCTSRQHAASSRERPRMLVAEGAL